MSFSFSPPKITFPIITVVCSGAVQQLTTDTTIWYEEGNLSLGSLKNDGTTAATPVHFVVQTATPADVTFANGVELTAGGKYSLPIAQNMKDTAYQGRASEIWIKGASGNVIHFQYSKRA